MSVGIDTREEKLDNFTDTVENFLVSLSKTALTEEQNEIINIMIQASTDFERIGDYATNINEFAQKIKNEELTFGESLPGALAVVVGSILLAYICLKLYDEPVRRYLANRFLKSKKR